MLACVAKLLPLALPVRASSQGDPHSGGLIVPINRVSIGTERSVGTSITVLMLRNERADGARRIRHRQF